MFIKCVVVNAVIWPEQLCLCPDRGNDNWLIKYEMPDIDETQQDVGWSIFLILLQYYKCCYYYY